VNSSNNMADTLSEGEIQFLASLAQAAAEDLSTDRASLEKASERFGPFRADYDNAANSLRDKGLVTGADDAISLTEAGEPLARAYHAERPDLYWYYFRKFYTAANASEAHSTLCERAFGKDLCQEGMVDMEALDDLIDRLQLHRGAAVLDLGCGAGGIAEYISDKTGASVTGLDISPSAIEVALSRTESKRDRLNFVIGDLNALDLPAENYDAAISLDALYWVSDLDQTLDAILAALRPGGQLAIHTLHGREADEPPEAMEPQTSSVAKALDSRGLSYGVSEHTANNAAFWKRNYAAAIDLRETFAAEGNEWIADSLIRESEEEFLPAFNAGLMARYLYLARV
jgi:ubiquinone/menaquinone biosynthesis C-methylase UbiE